tara:strand:+ start:349 stop:555 length:207 start_codon:yes stop_codon:yes gene_type:complete
MKTQSPKIQLLPIGIELKRDFNKRALQISQILPVIVKTSVNAELLEIEFQHIRNQLELTGQDFGPYDF